MTRYLHYPRATLALYILSAAALLSMNSAYAQTTEPITLPFETYLVRWWGTEGSVMTRPIYRMAVFDADAYQLHYGVMPGRELADYTMPYWPIRSFLSIVSEQAELAELFQVEFTVGGKTEAIGFNPRSGVEWAAVDDHQFLRIRNRSIKYYEDTTMPAGEMYTESNGCAIDQTFLMTSNRPSLQVRSSVANVGEGPFQELNARVIYRQSFNWGRFGVFKSNGYERMEAPAQGTTRAFYAFSSGMGRGFEFVAESNCELAYRLDLEMNAWEVAVVPKSQAGAVQFVHSLHIIHQPPKVMHNPVTAFIEPLDAVPFERVQPTEYRTSLVQTDGRVTISDMLQGLTKPKVRGLNLRAGFRQALKDLDTLKDWGCNLIIFSLGDPDQVAQMTEAAHSLDMDVFVAGHGSFKEGPPQFDSFFAEPRPREQTPDSYGQDEDHYYWFAIPPSRDFAADFGKPMAQATHDERVAYWADCFVDKWRGVRDTVRAHVSDAGVWFYAPFPSVAHVDPLDSYTPFMERLAQFDDRLTVFPFYYGIDYNQAEYMMRRWKDAGAPRAVFLPMRDFMTKPSQFIRAITAARRGQADGVTGFSFAVGDAPPEDQWQWKSVMLAAWANFPTLEQDAYCCIEEPAELVEALAESDATFEAVGPTTKALVNALISTSGEPVIVDSAPKPGDTGIHILLEVIPLDEIPVNQLDRDAIRGQSKGFILKNGRTVRLIGTDTDGLIHAFEWFQRFADLAATERGA